MSQSKPRTAKPSVGIDLGTTYSCVAVFQNGRPEVIANSQGNRITPSVVAFTKDGRLIGEGAEIQRKLDPPNAIYNSKRFIGRTWDEPTVQENCLMYPFQVVEKNQMIQFQVDKGPKTMNLTPEEIAAAILGKMKEIAEDYLEETVEDVVITVPAYFTDSQRQATVNAGKIAGLNVTRIINEPTAAAMAYGLKEGAKEDEGKHILVYDLGGGTFDVSVLEIEDDLIQVKATAGNTNLGGEDFNDLIVKHFKQEIWRKHKFDLTSNHKAIRRLTGACEKVKRNLSALNVKTSKLELDNFLPNGKDFVSALSRAKFENLCKERFEETIKCVDQALKDAGLIKEEIDEIVLVGGSSRIPKLQLMLTDYFNYKTLNKSINPDEAVACGAAVQAAIINDDPHLAVKDLLLMDVLPLSIGYTLAGKITRIVLERNTNIPVRKTVISTTASNNQTVALFEVTEGERTMSKDNKILGAFNIRGLPQRKAGEVNFETVFEMNENGILSVSATLIGTYQKAGITLDVRSAGKLSDKEVKTCIQEAKKMKMADQNEENRISAMNKLTSLCNHISFVSKDLSETDLGDVLKSVKDCITWVDKNPNGEEAQFTSKYNALSIEAEKILSISAMRDNSQRSCHVLRMGKHKAKYYIKEGKDLLLSGHLNDKIKASEYFYKAFKIAIDEGKLFKAIEALLQCGHTHRTLTEGVQDNEESLTHAFNAIKCLTFALDLEQNKTISEDDRKIVIQDIQFTTEKSFKLIENLEENDKFDALKDFMLALDNRNAAKNSAFCQIALVCYMKQLKFYINKVNASLAKDDFKVAQKFLHDLNYPKEQAMLLANSQLEKKQLAEVIEVIQRNMLHAEGLKQIDQAIKLLEDAQVDQPDIIDKALMALDYLSDAKHSTENTHNKVFIKAIFFEGKIFMDYIMNTCKAKSCFEKVVSASEQNHFNTDECREAKYILEQILKDQHQEEEKVPSVSRETMMNELYQDLQKIKQANNSLSDEKFVNFLLTEYPPKHKENYKKPVIATNTSGSKKKAYIRLSMFYHPDKVGASHGEKYKALCGEISKFVNGRFLKM